MPLRHELNERAIGEWQLRLMSDAQLPAFLAASKGEGHNIVVYLDFFTPNNSSAK